MFLAWHRRQALAVHLGDEAWKRCHDRGVAIRVAYLDVLDERARRELVSQLVHTDSEDAEEAFALADCFFVTPDGVGGLIEDEADVELFCREALHHSRLQRDASGPSPHVLVGSKSIGAPGLGLADAVRSALKRCGAAVVPAFLGGRAATQLAGRAEAWRDVSPAVEGAKFGGGRGDLAALMDEPPDVLLERLDALVGDLRRGGGECAARLRLCRFRSWPMASVYEPGARYTWHYDNTRRKNGRLLTCVYYTNAAWGDADGGCLRLMEEEAAVTTASVTASVPRAPCRVLAEVSPLMDTLVLFWADRIPHEVLAPHRGSRRAISVWYLCPRLGASQFLHGTVAPVDHQTASQAAGAVLTRLRSEGHSIDTELEEWLQQEASQ